MCYRYVNLWKTDLGNVSVPLGRDLHVLFHGQKVVCFVGGTGHWSKSEQGPEGCATYRAGARTRQGVLWLLEVSSAQQVCHVARGVWAREHRVQDRGLLLLVMS